MKELYDARKKERIASLKSSCFLFVKWKKKEKTIFWKRFCQQKKQTINGEYGLLLLLYDKIKSRLMF